MPARPASRRRLAGLAALTLGLGLLVAAPVAPTAAADDPVEPVAGGLTASPPDSLFPHQGNSGYDALHYDIDLAVDVAISPTNNAVASTTFPRASTTMAATTTGAPLSSFGMDFQGSSSTLANATLNVETVTVNGQPATFSRIENTTTTNATTDVHKLVVTPSAPVSGVFTTTVTYSGAPVRHVDTDGSSEGWNNTTDGATFVNQPVGAMTAFPHNNTPRDTATYTFTIDIPSKLTTSNQAQGGGPTGAPYPTAAVSNGELVSRTPSADGSRTTWVWDQAEPMASELSLISVGRYDMYTSSMTLASGRTIPEWSFIDPAISVANQTTTLSTRAQIKAVIDFFETKYGAYPGNSAGLVTDVVPSTINYALETQDRSFFPNAASRGTTYHEIMHQWWGNAVTPTDWNDIVISEGSASYAEYQFPFEGAGSTATSTDQATYNLWNGTAPSNSAFAVPPAAMTQASQLFGAQSYNKGAMSFGALRTVIGAADFETVMRQYQTTYGGGQVTARRTALFRAIAEEVSGRDLSAFFQAWWFSAGKPVWPARYNVNLAGPTVQVNPNDIYEYNLTVRNTGRVAMAAGAAVVTVDLADVMDDGIIGNLPSGATLDGTTMTWNVPATAIGATTTGTLPVFVSPGTAVGSTLSATESITTLGGTCLTCSSSVRVGTAPISPAPVPTISGGTPTVGSPLTADTTGWATGTSFAYQWFIDGSPVRGATSATFTPTFDVVGLAVTVQVTGTLAGFNTTARTSAATPVGVRATQPVATPTVAGTPKIGSPLTVSPGTWAPGTIFTYTWAANGVTIAGATGPTYTPIVASQVGQTLTATVNGTLPGFTTVARTSAATAAVATGDPLTLAPTPTLTGTPRVGASYVGSTGAWDDGTTTTYTWQANGINIVGATALSFTPTVTQLGQTLTLTVTGTKRGVTATRVSDPSPAVDLGTQNLQPTPTITGTPRVDSASTGVPGTWDTGTTRTYQWHVDGDQVLGAVAQTYTPTLGQLGKALTFEVTSTRPGYTTVVKVSEPKTIIGLAQTSIPTPTVSGTPQVGSVLTGDPGTWDDGTTLSYEWLADGSAVEGATALTYAPSPADVGKVFRFRVTSTKPDHETAVATSAPTDAVLIGAQTLAPTPTIVGTAKVGVELTGVPGTWDDGVDLDYQWSAGGDPIDGATSLTYTPGAARLGEAITFAVTGSRAGYEDVTRTSDPTDPVAAGDLAPTPVPTVTGDPKVGVELTGVPGTWDSDATLSYQWLADGQPVDGATALTFTPGPGRLGSVMTFAVTGTRTGYADVTRTSDPTAPVAAGDLAPTPVPTVTGDPKVGVELTGVPGSWDADATLSYQWLADGQPVDGATALTFTPGPGRVGDVITFAVTGTRTGYADVTRTSDPTDPVAAGDLAPTPVPTVTGDPKVGVQLTGVPGSWDADATLSYQWLADGQPVDGATALTFTPGPGRLGSVMTFAVTGTRTGYADVTRTSDPTAPVAAGDLTATPVPTITGTPKVGAELTGVPGAWDDGTTLSYQWRADGEPIGGATGLTYTPGADDVGAVVTLAVTGAKAGYADVTRTSAPTVPVATGDQATPPTPTVVGTSRVGGLLAVVPGAWEDGTLLSYQWLRNGAPVLGATFTTYVPTASDARQQVTVSVTGTRPGYEPATATSDAVTVALGRQSGTPKPRVKGKPLVGRTLRAVAGPVDPAAALSYRWVVGKKAVAAAGPRLVLRTSFTGKRVRVVVTARRPGYVVERGTSTSVGPVR